jgi:hypothetical protein
MPCTSWYGTEPDEEFFGAGIAGAGNWRAWDTFHGLVDYSFVMLGAELHSAVRVIFGSRFKAVGLALLVVDDCKSARVVVPRRAGEAVGVVKPNCTIHGMVSASAQG